MVTKQVIINEILWPAIHRLYHLDYDNIRFGASERNICARLAHHMENIMRDYEQHHDVGFFAGYYVDVEYNRMGNGDLKHYESSKHKPQYMVSDLLIQKRGYGRNLLAVEMKRKGNYKGVKQDKKRLKSLVSSPDSEDCYSCVHDTLLGAFIVYSPNDVTIEFYENTDGIGKMTNVQYLHF